MATVQTVRLARLEQQVQAARQAEMQARQEAEAAEQESRAALQRFDRKK
jgi:hypothetical protein